MRGGLCAAQQNSQFQGLITSGKMQDWPPQLALLILASIPTIPGQPGAGTPLPGGSRQGKAMPDVDSRHPCRAGDEPPCRGLHCLNQTGWSHSHKWPCLGSPEQPGFADLAWDCSLNKKTFTELPSRRKSDGLGMGARFSSCPWGSGINGALPGGQARLAAQLWRPRLSSVLKPRAPEIEAGPA